MGGECTCSSWCCRLALLLFIQTPCKPDLKLNWASPSEYRNQTNISRRNTGMQSSPDYIYNSFPHLFIHFLKGSFSRGCFSIKPLLRQGCSKLHRTLPSLRTCYRRWCTLLLSRKRPSHQKWRPRRPQWNQRQRKNPSLLEERQQKLRRLLQRVQVCLVWFITAKVGR